MGDQETQSGDQETRVGSEAEVEGVHAPAWDVPKTAFGHKPVPGILSAAAGRLRFQSDQEDASFDVPFEELEGLKLAQLGVLLKVTVNGRNYRFQFSRPNGAAAPTLLAVGNPGTAVGGIGGVAAAAISAKSLVEGHRAAKAFAAVLPV
jgi:hypothetical protein